jgi:hypothetical protein
MHINVVVLLKRNEQLNLLRDAYQKRESASKRDTPFKFVYVYVLQD